MSQDRRHLELELLLQRTIPGKLLSSDEPSLLQKLEAMGFDLARHAALAEHLNGLLNSQSQDTSPTPQTNAATTSTIDSLEEKGISYLQDFSVEGVLVEDPAEATS